MAQIALQFPLEYLYEDKLFDMKTLIRTPGFSKTDKWVIRTRNGIAEIHGPGGQWTTHIKD
jgi:hypothetical protein